LGNGCGGWNADDVKEKCGVWLKILKLPGKSDMCGNGDNDFGETGDHGEKW
jgi:hypothetical protein